MRYLLPAIALSAFGLAAPANAQTVTSSLSPAATKTNSSSIAAAEPVRDSVDEEEKWTTGEKAEGVPGLELGATLLEMPGAFIELAFAPVMPIALVLERYRLIPRLVDLLTNDELTLAVIPIVEPFNASGLGLGAALLRNRPLGSPDRTIFLTLIRLNRDRQVSFSYSRRIRQLSGRVVRMSVAYSVDRDRRFFGFGGAAEPSERRLLRTDAVDAAVGFDLTPRGTYVNMRVGIAYRYRQLRTGTSNNGTDVGLEEGDALGQPPGFGQALHYPEGTFALVYDSRDSVGRTRTGVLASLDSTISRDLRNGNVSGMRVGGSIGGFIPVLPLFRTLHLLIGSSIAFPIGDDARVPFQLMANLGGANRLRGYVSDRFIGNLGVWATVEYRYKIFEYAGSGNGFSSFLFADLGKVGQDVDKLIDGPLGWSLGIGLRAEANILSAGRIQFAFSGDGFRFSVGFGEVL